MWPSSCRRPRGRTGTPSPGTQRGSTPPRHDAGRGGHDRAGRGSVLTTHIHPGRPAGGRIAAGGTSRRSSQRAAEFGWTAPMCRSIPLAILWSTLARPRRPNVISNVHSTGRLRRLRKLLTPLLLGAGIVAGMIAVPGTALAIPSGGWCYADYYEFGTLNGEVFKPYGNVR